MPRSFKSGRCSYLPPPTPTPSRLSGLRPRLLGALGKRAQSCHHQGRWTCACLPSQLCFNPAVSPNCTSPPSRSTISPCNTPRQSFALSSWRELPRTAHWRSSPSLSWLWRDRREQSALCRFRSAMLTWSGTVPKAQPRSNTGCDDRAEPGQSVCGGSLLLEYF